MPSILVHWNRSQGDAWAEFFAVDFDDPHFDDLEGVFVIWQGGSQPAAISVGLGALRKELKAQRSDPAIAIYRGKPLFVSWAKVDKVARAGVARFLYETLKPRTLMTVPTTAPIDVNLPGRGESAPPDVSTPPPRQIYEDLLAPDAGALEEHPEQTAARKSASEAAAQKRPPPRSKPRRRRKRRSARAARPRPAPTRTPSRPPN